MKKYIKPSVTIVEIETGEAILAAVSNGISVTSLERNETDFAKGNSFNNDIWGLDEDE